MLRSSTTLNCETMKHLLIVAHAPSPNTLKLRDAAARGAGHEDIENVSVIVKAPLDAGPDDVMACDAILLGTTENLGYMSGALKDFSTVAITRYWKKNRDYPAPSTSAPARTAPAPVEPWKALLRGCAGTGYRTHWCCAENGKMPSSSR